MTNPSKGTASWVLAASLAAASALGPGCAATKPPAAPAVEAPTATAAPPSESAVAPRLVVLIVLDQFGSWALQEHLPLLPPDSVLRIAHEEGAFHTVELPFAVTQTAPSHASLVTGVVPAVHGIVANSIYEPGIGIHRTVDDRKHVVIGNRDRFVSPTRLQAESVADVLRRNSKGNARIMGVSMKARAAALSIGANPDIAVFYDAKARAMTTSTYYAPKGRLPSWLVDFNRANPVEPLLQTWEPGDPMKLERYLGPDAQPGEMFPTFPHDPRSMPDPPWTAFMSTPESSEYLIAAAYAAVKATRMGLDEVPDFLALSVSGTDTVGHIWGVRSWEYADNLLRIDRALTHLSQLLEARSPVSFVLTSDHGVAELPEHARAEGKSGGRLVARTLRTMAESAADAELGEGDWIAAYAAPLFTYTPAGKARHDELTRVVRKAMEDIEGVRAVYDARNAAELRSSSKQIERLVGASLPDDPPGDLYLVTQPGWFDQAPKEGELSKPGGTNHGTPWEYDRHVPVLMWGAAIERRTSRRTQDALRVAATLAALLNVPPPEGAPEDPLPGVMRLPD